MTDKVIRVLEFGGIALCFLFALFASGLYTHVAKAAVSIFNPTTCYTASATTSPAFLNVVGTSTVTCAVGPDGANSAVVTVEVNASSTLTSFVFGVEESYDGIDWYPVHFGQNASTSPNFSLYADSQFVYTFASSTTLGGAGALSGLQGNNRNQFVVDIPIRMRKVRVWSSLTLGSAAGAVWLQIVPRQNVN